MSWFVVLIGVVMEVTLSLYTVAFWAAIFFTGIGAALGLMGVWIQEFWRSDVAVKLLMTNAILAGTSILVAAMTKWLG